MDKSALEHESMKDKKLRAEDVFAILRLEYPEAECHLNFSSPFELLIGTMLAAQCTDVRVNEVTPRLFAKYATPQEFSLAKQKELEKEIYSTGFYKNKAKAIIRCCKGLIEKHDGRVPDTMDELIELDGVGRKTANVVLGNAYNIPGIIVDTHFIRLTGRLGFSQTKNPDLIERDLMELVPSESWTKFSNTVGEHGRTICKAKKPLCGACAVRDLCPSVHLDN